MENLDLLWHGFAVACTPANLGYLVLGVVLGQIIGALPGVGPAAGMALLLPFTYVMEPISGVIMLASIMYGGILTSVLLNVPGESSSLMSAVDGYQVARKGRAGAALTIAAIGSFLAGVASVTALVFVAPALREFALRFSAPEYFLLAALGITATASLGGASAAKALLAAALGLMISQIGVDPIIGLPRLTFGDASPGGDRFPAGRHRHLRHCRGAGVARAAERHAPDSCPPPRNVDHRRGMGGQQVRDRARRADRLLRGRHAGRWPHHRLDDVLRGGAPIQPAARPLRSWRHRRAGRVGIRQHAASHSALAPMLALGIPGSSSTAVLLAALILLGIRPGPGLMTEQPDLVWGLMASMFIGNVVLLVINLPLAPVFASILRIPYGFLAPAILVISLFGAYSSTLSLYPVGIALLFGLVGWLMMKLDYPRAPLVLALVLAPLLETSLRQSLLLSLGSPMIFLERPISAILSAALVATLVWPLVAAARRLWRTGA